jgi:hypothetical protein
LVTVTSMPVATNTSQPITQPAAPTATQPGQPIPNTGANGAGCNLAYFEADLNYVDDTEVPAGTNFDKKWRLRNNGSCTWTSSYRVIFVSGDAMGGAGSTQLTNGTVAPGSSVDVSVNLTAPAAAGTYRGNFKLQAADGTTFGIDGAGSVFYVRIIVPGGDNNSGGSIVKPLIPNIIKPSIPELTRNLKLTTPYMTGDDVLKLQKKLLARGYSAVGKADGIFGKNTDKGVRQFQADQGLVVDGVVGQKTWKALWS